MQHKESKAKVQFLKNTDTVFKFWSVLVYLGSRWPHFERFVSRLLDNIVWCHVFLLFLFFPEYLIVALAILKETRNATKSNMNFCVFSWRFLVLLFWKSYYFQDRELKSKNVSLNDGLNGEYDKHIYT